ncbi:hypothetical protein QKT49_gp161 [Acanthamoeba castellanii medusavirus]|uniref:Uncharacterized protein n=1 Tax=Acanthamoeba castellanii medusavirus J1 TaxID=3114988 RepID=A0A3T1CWV0_9VIRU|nr:hypothetical protein QKT49_gp161 [Acanthamoeba castellanii medusavirus]BBI30301.1 hypothetical protein [Acanthamoeba castellanii medusavirus J1]
MDADDQFTRAWNILFGLAERFSGPDANRRYLAWASVIAELPDDLLNTIPLGDIISCVAHGDVRHAICNGYYEAPDDDMYPTPKRAERWLRNNTK